MTGGLDAFGQRILEKRKTIADSALAIPLRIAVLGPSLDGEGNSGSQKRRQIARALKEDGHDTFFPEDHVRRENPALLVVQEHQLLSDDSVDLVIILHTEDSSGVLVEIGNFAGTPEITNKTGVLFPFQHYKPEAEPGWKHSPSIL